MITIWRYGTSVFLLFLSLYYGSLLRVTFLYKITNHYYSKLGLPFSRTFLFTNFWLLFIFSIYAAFEIIIILILDILSYLNAKRVLTVHGFVSKKMPYLNYSKYGATALLK